MNTTLPSTNGTAPPQRLTIEQAVELGRPVYVCEAPAVTGVANMGVACYGLPENLPALSPPSALQSAAVVLLHGQDDDERQRMQAHADAFLKARWASVKLVAVPSETVIAWLMSAPSAADLTRREEHTPHHTATRAPKMQPVDWMTEYAVKRARLIVAPSRETYASVSIKNGARATFATEDRAFGQWLAQAYRAEHKSIPPRDAVKQAQETLEAIALDDGHHEDVFVRIARVGDVCYVDLGDDMRRVVQISGDGVRLLHDSPVAFYRTSAMHPLPAPVIYGTDQDAVGGLVLLRTYFHLATDNDTTLFTAWLIYLLSGVRPFPLLSLSGDQDAGKSTAADYAKRLIDPGTPKLLQPPKSIQDLMVSAKGRYILGFDNLSSIPLWLSNAFSSISTGGGFATRRLHTDTDETVIEVARPILLNGIDDVVKKHDLGSRTLRIHLSTVPVERRVALSDLEERFEAHRPEIFGALCYAASCALRTAHTHKGRPMPVTTRMIDFVIWGRATQHLYNYSGGDDFDVAFRHNMVSANQEAAEDDPIVSAIRDLVAAHKRWEGTAADLLDALQQTLPKWTTAGLGPEKLALHIKRMQAVLPSVGIAYSRYKSTDKGRRRLLSFSLLSE